MIIIWLELISDPSHFFLQKINLFWLVLNRENFQILLADIYLEYGPGNEIFVERTHNVEWIRMKLNLFLLES